VNQRHRFYRRDRWLARQVVELALALVGGCGRVGEAIQDVVQAEVEARVRTGDTQMPGTLAPPALTDQDRLADKLALYHECLRRSRVRIIESHARWIEGVDPKTGGARRGGPRPLVYPVETELQPCHRAVDEGPLQTPLLPVIEAAAAEYLAASATFAVIAAQLDQYYGAEAFKQDGWALGKALAPGLVAAWERWQLSLGVLDGELERVRDGLDELRLAQAGATGGPSMRWHCHRTMLAAKGLERCARRESLTAETCDGALATFDARLAELLAWAEAHPSEAEQAFWWPSFEAALADFAEDAHAIDARLASKKFDGDLAGLRDHHDEVRAAFDNLRFDLGA